MQAERTLLVQRLKRLLDGREIYLWGARQAGFSMFRVLKRLGYQPTGFIDSSASMKGASVLGLDVHEPRSILDGKGPRPFILITSGFFSDDIADTCREAGFDDDMDFISYAQLQAFDYQVDVAGACNLRCISCPRGNYPIRPPAGNMTARTYRQVLDKILREDPLVGVITLYNWGEPLLNPQLPEIVRHTNERGVHAAISSNLSLKIDFEDVIRARPTWFRVSVSGWGDRYEVTHTGGKWDLFHANLHKLRRYREEHHPGMLVEVFFHIYEHNRNDVPRLQELSDELGFTFRFRHAALAPLDNVEAFIEGAEMTPEARQTISLQSLKIGEAMERAREQRQRECFYERCLWITWDLRVAQCMEWFKPDLSLVEGDFLSTPLQDIIDARRGNAFCQRCRERAIHRCYIIYGDETLVHQKRSLGVR